MDIDLDEDDLFSAGLQILESRRASSRTVHCYACDEEMKAGPLLICAECLSDECDLFLKKSDTK